MAPNDDAPKGKPKRRKRGGGRNWERKKLGGPKGPPPTPQLKVTIRNIHNADLNGTVQHVGDRILRKLVQLAGDKLNTPDRIVLQWDEAGFRALAEADEAARKLREEWKSKQESDGKNIDTKETSKEGEVADTIETTHSNDESSDLPSAVVEGMEHLTIDNPPQDEPTIHVRALYVLPPKKTKRRGEKTGCAYLVLTAPPIAARELDPDAASTRSGKSASDQAPAPIDYSQDVAKRRLMIQRTLEALIKTAEEDAKTKQEFSECVVLESLSGKTWKPRTDTIRRDRMEGTIEETADYKAFFEKSEQEKEERKARPKPAPGGGVSSVMTSASSSINNGGQPIAAIVLHLRKKQEEEKKRKQGKSKPKEGNGNKGLPNQTDTKAGAKKVRGGKNKRNKKTSSNGTSKPSAGVKPGSG
ncbi:hypothetical protein FisN_22Hh171 [Fistulifera solaris]|jgi:hypothetical protein|uniref:Uncharacterized protein n=1 Tax=Fistulifera solaris TaxID=1519565 RepID=A0A1Z5JPN6_FISSO|nr:hypothetical protein FisN_22Hh171 [Fistulifera solaris]|eukprot:GAX15974.1 hypothetical protein FisN_22Hh171 [Fistulifera solaris]